MDNPEMDMLAFERRVHQQGFQRVAGIDEAGRGPLAGPVVAAAVVLPQGLNLPGVMDSKMLNAGQREICYRQIVSCAVDMGVGCVEVTEIDRINILKASFKAMLLAVKNLQAPPDFLLIDGPYTLPVFIPQRGIPKGDQLSLSIAAASIVAKVRRDRIMHEYHQLYPDYGFDRHKGYATKGHLQSLRKYGACPIHRMTFRGVDQTKGGCRVAIRQKRGKQGELLASEFLEKHGLKIDCRNFRCPIGEIDLIARDKKTIVFIEVKSRYSGSYGLPQDSVTRSKQRRLTRLGQWYIKQNRLEGKPARFDVVAIDWHSVEPEITWIVNAFEACE